MDNPFFATSMIWANDLGFDGITLQGRYKVAKGVTPFLTAGAYPVFNTDFNFASNQPAKYESEDKYLFAGQLGANLTINKDFNGKVAGALYYFDNIEGHLSDPFTPLASGPTRATRTTAGPLSRRTATPTSRFATSCRPPRMASARSTSSSITASPRRSMRSISPGN